ncbi:hypothetical protein SAMN05192543_10662 [Paraburkholderia megapolitana]|uniref:Uncharacterized protein n=1 Tax=Paraburkholderia megapolitana TaxID=420953 RepID=A0A1I3PSK7_9BURK|nr:hypothetical protein SAMN05192543_10662 [Paraburkholderia megapolitana]
MPPYRFRRIPESRLRPIGGNRNSPRVWLLFLFSRRSAITAAWLMLCEFPATESIPFVPSYKTFP